MDPAFSRPSSFLTIGLAQLYAYDPSESEMELPEIRVSDDKKSLSNTSKNIANFSSRPNFHRPKSTLEIMDQEDGGSSPRSRSHSGSPGSISPRSSNDAIISSPRSSKLTSASIEKFAGSKLSSEKKIRKISLSQKDLTEANVYEEESKSKLSDSQFKFARSPARSRPTIMDKEIFPKNREHRTVALTEVPENLPKLSRFRSDEQKPDIALKKTRSEEKIPDFIPRSRCTSEGALSSKSKSSSVIEGKDASISEPLKSKGIQQRYQSEGMELLKSPEEKTALLCENFVLKRGKSAGQLNLPRLLSGDKLKNPDSEFMKAWKKYEFPALLECNSDRINDCVKDILQSDRIRLSKKTSSVHGQRDMDPSLNIETPIALVQENLIKSSPIYKRLNEIENFIHKYNLDHKCNTIFMKALHGAIMDLKVMSEGDLFNFMDYLSDIYSQDTEIKNKIKFVVENILGDTEGEKASVLKVLNKFNTKDLPEELVNNHNETVNEASSKIIDLQNITSGLQNITCREHIWREPISHEGTPSPIDQISLHDVYDYYKRHGRNFPITINGEKLIVEKKNTTKTFLLIFFSNLYKACGFDVDKNTLIKQIQELELDDECDVANLSPQMLQCLRLLKLGAINSWLRGDSYWKLRFDSLRDTPFDLSSSENLGLNIHIDREDPKKSYVEQIKNFKLYDFNKQIDLSKYTEKTSQINEKADAVIPVSWKAFIPADADKEWLFVLRPLEVGLYIDVSPERAKSIVDYLLTTKNNEFVEEQLKNDGIKVECIFNEALTPKGIEILPSGQRNS